MKSALLTFGPSGLSPSDFVSLGKSIGSYRTESPLKEKG
jgi:hypothetical protein